MSNCFDTRIVHNTKTIGYFHITLRLLHKNKLYLQGRFREIPTARPNLDE